MFTNGAKNRIQSQVESYQKCYLMSYCLTFNIIKYGSRVGGAIQGNELRLFLHLGVVAIDKRDFGLPSTTVGQLTTTYRYTRAIRFIRGIFSSKCFYQIFSYICRLCH